LYTIMPCFIVLIVSCAMISRSIKKAEVVAYEELGAEALRRLEVEDFPVTVVNDIYGGDLYEEGKARYQVKAT
jgi:fumarate hydratase subunit beta